MVLLEQALKHATGHKDDGTEHEDEGIVFFCARSMYAEPLARKTK